MLCRTTRGKARSQQSSVTARLIKATLTLCAIMVTAHQCRHHMLPGISLTCLAVTPCTNILAWDTPVRLWLPEARSSGGLHQWPLRLHAAQHPWSHAALLALGLHLFALTLVAPMRMIAAQALGVTARVCQSGAPACLAGQGPPAVKRPQLPQLHRLSLRLPLLVPWALGLALPAPSLLLPWHRPLCRCRGAGATPLTARQCPGLGSSIQGMACRNTHRHMSKPAATVVLGDQAQGAGGHGLGAAVAGSTKGWYHR